MIRADTLRTLTSMGPYDLKVTLATSGDASRSFKTSTFLGLTNGGEFCYKVTYLDDADAGEKTGKVFVSYDAGTIIAKFE